MSQAAHIKIPPIAGMCSLAITTERERLAYVGEMVRLISIGENTLYRKWFVVRCPVWASWTSTQFCRAFIACSIPKQNADICQLSLRRCQDHVTLAYSLTEDSVRVIGCSSERRYWEIHEMGKICLQVPFFWATVMRQRLCAGLCFALWIFAVFEGCTEPPKCVFFSTTWLFSSTELSSTEGDSSILRHNG